MEAWRVLCREYQSAVGGRFANMLRNILNPKQWQSSGKLQRKPYLMGQPRAGVRTAEYREGKPIILEHGPTRIAESLRFSGPDVRDNYRAMRDAMRCLYEPTREYSSTQTYAAGIINENDSTPMDVSAVFCGKGKKGKCKVGKYNKGKATEENNGKGRQTTEKLDGECGYCGKWGHTRHDCRKKTDDEKGKGKGASAASVGAEGTSVCSAMYEDWNMEQKHDSWAFAVQVEFVACSAGTRGERLLILADSGSDEHLCPIDFAGRVAVEPLAYPLKICDVSGKILTVDGTRRVRVLLDGTADTVIPFVVADATRPIV
jgi:hypothetical protein